MHKHKLIVASPTVQGKFSTAVFFLMEHSENGAMGVALNQPSDEIPCTCGRCPKYTVYLGGPFAIGEAMLMLHGVRGFANRKRKLMNGLWLGGPKTLDKCLTLPMDDRRFKVFTGFNGWAPGQLESEIDMGIWTVVEATPELVLDGDPAELWHRLTPVKPSLNFSMN